MGVGEPGVGLGVVGVVGVKVGMPAVTSRNTIRELDLFTQVSCMVFPQTNPNFAQQLPNDK